VFTPSFPLNAIVLNKILYALPVYFGYLTEGQKDMFRSRRVFKKVDRMGIIFCAHDLDLLNDTAQYELFCRSLAEQHCLHHLFTVKPRPPGAMQLRQRGHSFTLPLLNMNLTSIILLLVHYFLTFNWLFCVHLYVYAFYNLILLYTIVSTILPICVNMCTCHVFL